MSRWTEDNTLELLENGEAYYPRVFAAIASARREVLLETFIWAEDEVGEGLAQALMQAARNGATVRATVDGYGTPDLSAAFLDKLAAAGVEVVSFDPRPTLFRIRVNLLCRLHTKIVVVDDERAFVGGINYSEDHLRSHGADSKQDYAVEIQGPVVADIAHWCRAGTSRRTVSRLRRWRYWLRRLPREMTHPTASAQVLFVTRDNAEHPTDIETLYRAGIRKAKKQVIIANAYFFPGYRFVRELRRAARRGVDVLLVMQGKPDRPMTIGAASVVYDDLLAAGVRIVRYVERPLHAKVAVIDEAWATVGSSNLDPISLGLNLEANVFVLDRAFNRTLRERLEVLVEEHCEPVEPSVLPRPRILRRLFLTFAYHLTRRMYGWGKQVPTGLQKYESLASAGSEARD